MKLLKKYNFIYNFLIFILIITIIQTFINIIFPLENNINKIISFIMIILYSIKTGYKKGKVTESKAYKEGIKIGLINILTLYVLGCLTFSFTISINKLIYYSIILITTILGSIIGINKKVLK